MCSCLEWKGGVSLFDLHPSHCTLVSSVTSQFSLAHQRAVSRRSVTHFIPPGFVAADWPPNILFLTHPHELALLAQFMICDHEDPSASVCLFAQSQYSCCCRPAVLSKLARGCARCLSSSRSKPHRGLVFKRVFFTSVCCHVSPVKRRKFSGNFPPSVKISPQFTSRVVGLWLYFCFSDEAELWFRVQQLIKRNNLNFFPCHYSPYYVCQMEPFVIILELLNTF